MFYAFSSAMPARASHIAFFILLETIKFREFSVCVSVTESIYGSFEMLEKIVTMSIIKLNRFENGSKPFYAPISYAFTKIYYLSLWNEINKMKCSHTCSVVRCAVGIERFSFFSFLLLFDTYIPPADPRHVIGNQTDVKVSTAQFFCVLLKIASKKSLRGSSRRRPMRFVFDFRADFIIHGRIWMLHLF